MKNVFIFPQQLRVCHFVKSSEMTGRRVFVDIGAIYEVQPATGQ